MCYCNGWLPPLAVPYLMQCSPLVVAASLPVFWELMQTNMTVRAAILDLPVGFLVCASLASCIHSIAEYGFMYCRPMMSFVLSFTRIGRVTQIVGARGFIKGASEVSFSTGPCMTHQHALRHSLLWIAILAVFGDAFHFTVRYSTTV